MTAGAKLTERQMQMLRHLYETGALDMHQSAASFTLRTLINKGLITAPSATTGCRGCKISPVALALFEEEQLRSNRLSDFSVGEQIEQSHFSVEQGVWTHEWRMAIVARIGPSVLILDYPDGRKGQCDPRHARRSAGSGATQRAPVTHPRAQRSRTGLSTVT